LLSKTCVDKPTSQYPNLCQKTAVIHPVVNFGITLLVPLRSCNTKIYYGVHFTRQDEATGDFQIS